MSRELHQFLAQQNRAGAFDSKGEFTIDAGRAVEKLRRHRLLQRSDFLLKMIQAAVASGAENVEVALSYHSVRLGFLVESNSPLGTASAVLPFMDEPQNVTARAMHHLVVALTSAIGQPYDEVEWFTRNRQVTETLVIQRDEARLRKAEGLTELPAGAVLYQLRLSRCQSRELEKTLRSLTEDYTVLMRRCCLAPIDIWCDGRRILAPWADRAVEKDRFPQALGLHLELAQAEQFAAAWLPPFVGHKFSPLADGVQVWRGQAFLSMLRGSQLAGDRPVALLSTSAPPPAGEQLKCLWATRLRLHLNSLSQVDVLKDGVLLDPINGPDELYGFHFLVDGTELEVDLSEFNLRRTDELQTTVEGLRQRAHDLGRRVWAHRRRLGPLKGKKPQLSGEAFEKFQNGLQRDLARHLPWVLSN